MTKFDFCSDLHVDAWYSSKIYEDQKFWLGEPNASTYLHIDWQKYKNPESEILVIAGDTANNLMITKEVVEAACLAYQHVVVVEGNHDHYNNEMSVDAGHLFLKQMLEQFNNAHLLSGNDVFVHNGTMFCGATGWYDFKAFEDKGISDDYAKRTWNRYSRDASYVNFDRSSPEELSLKQANEISDQVHQANNDDDIHSIVVVTHMSPRSDIMEWKSYDPTWNALTPSYVNTHLNSVLEADTKSKIKYWVYGHTHRRQMLDINGVVYCNNARGYPGESPPWTLTQLEINPT